MGVLILIVGAGFGVAYNDDPGVGEPSVMGHSAGEISGGAGGGAFGDKTNLDSDGNVLVVDNVYLATSDGFVMANGYANNCYIQARDIGGAFSIVSRGGNWHDASWYDALFYPVSENEEIQWICAGPQHMWFKPIGSGELEKQ